jgi:hypothetical protein
MSDSPYGERRRHPRYDLLAQVRVKRGAMDTVVELHNVSSSGALLHLGKLRRPAWVEMNRRLEIGIVHPVELDLIELQGRVVRVVEEDTGIALAVEFVDATPEALRGIERLVSTARESESPASSRRPQPPPLPKS